MSYRDRNKFKVTLQKEEVIDILFLVLMPVFALTLVYQITFIQSNDAQIKELGTMALGLSALTIVGISLLAIFASSGIVKIKNLRKTFKGDMEGSKKLISIKDLINEDPALQTDYLNIFIFALLAQIGFSFIYGGFTGSVFDLEFQWNINSLLLTVNAAVAEELFFCLFLAALMLSLCKELWHIFVVGFINVFGFLLVHAIVYGTQPEAIFYIIFLRVLYFYIYYKTRRVSIPILLHCLNNFLFIRTILFI